MPAPTTYANTPEWFPLNGHALVSWSKATPIIIHCYIQHFCTSRQALIFWVKQNETKQNKNNLQIIHTHTQINKKKPANSYNERWWLTTSHLIVESGYRKDTGLRIKVLLKHLKVLNKQTNKIFFTWEYSKEWYSSSYFSHFLMSTKITNHVTAFLQNHDIPSGCGEALNDIRLSILNSFVRHNRCMKNQTTAPSNTDRQLFRGIFFFSYFPSILMNISFNWKKQSSTEQLFL